MDLDVNISRKWLNDAIIGIFPEIHDSDVAILKEKSIATDNEYMKKAHNMIAEMRERIDDIADKNEQVKLTQDWISDSYCNLLHNWIFEKLKYNPIYQSKGDYALAETLIPCMRDVFEKEPLHSPEIQKILKRGTIKLFLEIKKRKEKTLPGVDLEKLADQIARFVIIKEK
jgi:hypothetical protein